MNNTNTYFYHVAQNSVYYFVSNFDKLLFIIFAVSVLFTLLIGTISYLVRSKESKKTLSKILNPIILYIVPFSFVAAFIVLIFGVLVPPNNSIQGDYDKIAAPFNQSVINYNHSANTFTLQDNTTNKVVNGCTLIEHDKPNNIEAYNIYCSSNKSYLKVSTPNNK